MPSGKVHCAYFGEMKTSCNSVCISQRGTEISAFRKKEKSQVTFYSYLALYKLRNLGIQFFSANFRPDIDLYEKYATISTSEGKIYCGILVKFNDTTMQNFYAFDFDILRLTNYRKHHETATCDKAGQPNDVCPCGQVMLPSAMMFTA